MTVTHRTQSSGRPARHAAGTAPSERVAPPSSGLATVGPKTADRSDEPTVPAGRRPDGAWRDGDPVGGRQFVHIVTWSSSAEVYCPTSASPTRRGAGFNDAGDNVVLVEHALTGDSHVVGEAVPGHASPGGVNSLIAEGGPVDPRRVVRRRIQRPRRLPGQHRPVDPAHRTTALGSRFPYVTVRDQVSAERLLLNHLGIRRVAAVVGGSMGGMRAIEWAVTHPDDVDRCIVLASTARATADQIAWCQPQLLAIRHDPDFAGGDYYSSDRRRPTRDWVSPVASPTSPTARSPSSTSASGAQPSSARTRCARVTEAASPSSPTSTTTPASWRDGSTPTPMSS